MANMLPGDAVGSKRRARSSMMAGRLAETSANAPRAGSLLTPEQWQQINDLNDQDYTPLDLAHDVSDFSTGIVEDAASIPQGLIDIAQALFRGADPGDLAYEAVQGQLDQWSDPVQYANEHPLFFMGDVAGAAGLAGGALSSAARRAGTTVPEFLAADEGAIGPLGRRLMNEVVRGEATANLENFTIPYDYLEREMAGQPIEPVLVPQMKGGKPVLTAASPNMGYIPESLPGARDSGPVLLKPPAEASPWDWDQVQGEMAYQALNKALGEPVRMPGSTTGDFDYATMSNAGSRAEITGVEPVQEGLIQEFLSRAEPAAKDPRLMGSNPVAAHDARMLSLMDYITGNRDRTWNNHNLLQYEGRILPIDNGLAFKKESSMLRPESDDFIATPAQWPGLVLSDADRSLLSQAKAEIQKGLADPISNDLGYYGPEGGLQAAIRRIDEALGRNTLYETNATPAEWNAAAFDDLEQPGVVGDPSWHSSWDGILNTPDAAMQEAQVIARLQEMGLDNREVTAILNNIDPQWERALMRNMTVEPDWHGMIRPGGIAGPQTHDSFGGFSQPIGGNLQAILDQLLGKING